MNYIKTGEFLKSLRKSKGLTQQAVADELYINSKTISKWENGDSIPDIGIIENVALFYGVTVDEILKGRRNSFQEDAEKDQIDNKTQRIIANAIKRKYSIYFYIALGIIGVLFITSLIVYAIDEFIVSLVLYLFGLLSSLFIMILGSQVCYQEIDDYDEELIKKGYDKAKKILNLNNKLYSDIFILLIIVFIMIYALSNDLSFFLSSFSNSSIFNILVVIEDLAGLSLILISYLLIRNFIFKKINFNKLRNNILIISVIISFFYILFGIRVYYINDTFITIEPSFTIHNGLLFIIEYITDIGIIFPMMQMVIILGSILAVICKKIVPVLINVIIILISTIFTQTIDTGDYFVLSPISIILIMMSICCLCYLLCIKNKNINEKIVEN